MSSRSINAAVLHGLGQTPRYGPFPAPVPGGGHTVVDVGAAALKPSDRLMAMGLHDAPSQLPVVVGLDGVGRLDDGTRVGFFVPEAPYGGMAERALVRRGMWLPVPDGVDDVVAAACLNPGMTAWKAVMWAGELAAGQTVLVLGATGTSGRIAAQLAMGAGARVVVAGRNQRVLDQLLTRGAVAAITVGRPYDELVADLADAGPYDLVVDYLWGAPAEAVFAAVVLVPATRRTRYIQVGVSAGTAARLPGLTLRAAPVELIGSGIGGPAAPEASAAAYRDLLARVADGELVLDLDVVPLADVEHAWHRAGSEERVVFVP